MTQRYETADGELTEPDQPKQPLDRYHDDIEAIISAELLGLTGRDTKIFRIIVGDELSDSEQSDLEQYLNGNIELVDEL